MASGRLAPTILEAFGAAVRDARSRLGQTQEEFCFEADLDRTYLSGIERGVRNPTLMTIERLSNALGMNPSDLMREAERRMRRG